MVQQFPDYSIVLPFEDGFDRKPWSVWLTNNFNIAYLSITAYLIIVFGGQQWMKNRKAFQLNGALIVWNLLLAIFSIMGAIRTLPELYHLIRYHGFHHAVCDPGFSSVTQLWSVLFTLSKVPELVDTVFMVLRKRKVMFLHWYHHITVLWLAWNCAATWSAPGRWYVDMNYLVHAFMYSYYALRAMGVKVPKPLAMVITLLQIVQMVLGTFITSYAFWAKRTSFCVVTDSIIYPGLFIYFSYLLLFANFFRIAYLKKQKRDLNARKHE